MSNHFRAGFGDELIKQAFIGGALRAIGKAAIGAGRSTGKGVVGAAKAVSRAGGKAKGFVKGIGKKKPFDPTNKKHLTGHLKELKGIQAKAPKQLTAAKSPKSSLDKTQYGNTPKSMGRAAAMKHSRALGEARRADAAKRVGMFGKPKAGESQWMKNMRRNANLD